MRKQVLLTGLLTVSLLMPLSEAKAQGWPTFDVAKLASLITNLVGRFQPVPQVLSRVNQVKTTMTQIQAVGQAAASGDLKAMGQAAASALESGAFSFKDSEVTEAGEGENGASDASKKIKDTMFSKKNIEMTMDEFNEMSRIRDDFKKGATSEALARSFYMAMNAAKQAEERFKKADEAMQNAETIQDSINANTMMIMNGNYDRLNQISLKLSSLKKLTADYLIDLPTGGYQKPEPVKNLKLGEGEYSVQEKDEIDVNFE